MDQSKKGEFLVKYLSPGTSTLELSSPGYAGQTVAVEVLSSQTTRRTFYLVPEGRLFGFVLLNGEGRESASVQLYRKELRVATFARADAKGYYELTGLTEGDYWVHGGIEINGVNGSTLYINGLKRVHIESGKDIRMDFHFQNNTGISGEFRCADKTLGGCVLVLDPLRDASLPVIQRACVFVSNLEKSRQYEITTLPPGTYTVVGRCTKKGVLWEPVNGMEKSVTVTLAPGQIEQVDFVFP